jgi:hypothetical protein
MTRLTLAALAALAMLSLASAHDESGNPNWIAAGHYQGPDGIHCCGPADCAPIKAERVTVTPAGYRLIDFNNEIVPFGEAQQSEDSHFWRCRRGDGTRRCFFIPPSGS